MPFIDKPDWEMAQKRSEAFWEGEVLDRACIRVTAPKAPRAPEYVPREDLPSWWLDPERVIPRQEAQIANTVWGGEAFPVMFPTSTGIPAITAAFLGSELHFVGTDTGWCEPIIHDWKDRPPLKFDPQNKWWKVNVALLSAAAARAKGRYAVGVPDLNGPGEVLARLRGTAELAFDTIDHPDEIHAAMAEINQAWFDCWQACWEVIHQSPEQRQPVDCRYDSDAKEAALQPTASSLQPLSGWVFWMGTWSSKPATDLQCDFSIMVSKAMFDEFFLRPLEDQTRMVARTIYHLDGPGAARHLDSLLAMENLSGIQWVPGAGAKPMSEWIDLLQAIQAGGKLLWISCQPSEVEKLLKALKPEGLMLSTHCARPEEIDEVLRMVEKLSRKK